MAADPIAPALFNVINPKGRGKLERIIYKGDSVYGDDFDAGTNSNRLLRNCVCISALGTRSLDADPSCVFLVIDLHT